MTDPHAFHAFPIANGVALDLSGTSHPTMVRMISSSSARLPEGETHFGIVTRGTVVLEAPQGTVTLVAGMYFSLPDAIEVDASAGALLAIGSIGYRGLRQWGGPIESRGRLEYIDGCSDTLLICPPRLGEPCLNHLHIPPGTSQSRHTHPTERIGVILRGSGECRTPSGTWPLTPGLAWRIPPGCLHSFFTTDESLDVLAWHPDSDFGPTDGDHPMVNRTVLAHG
ncbi:MAG: cupin domain-containing protein [Armatimonadota bacterium]